MTNPLDRQLQIYQATMDAITVTRNILSNHDNPLDDTIFPNIPPHQLQTILSEAEDQLKQLVAFALFTTFERTLRDHLTASLQPVATADTIPAELADQLHAFLQDSVDNWRIDRVIKLFKPPAATQDIHNASTIRSYRNKVAHGALPPSALTPQAVHYQLTQFLANIGLLHEDQY